ncbi:MAG: hypothetical protein SFU56_02490 [Capsulimonadales bacterium]|nr:hypothetical protein [Capsulimonadales bacterium]
MTGEEAEDRWLTALFQEAFLPAPERVEAMLARLAPVLSEEDDAWRTFGRIMLGWSEWWRPAQRWVSGTNPTPTAA